MIKLVRFTLIYMGLLCGCSLVLFKHCWRLCPLIRISISNVKIDCSVVLRTLREPT